jgi:hypothetical protein
MVTPFVDEGQTAMRILVLVPAIFLLACETAPVALPATDPPVSPTAAEITNLPDFRPETAAACNAVPLSVGLSASGALTVNGESSTQEGLRAAAERKNAACRNAPAMVFFNAPSSVPAATREATLTTLGEIIVNIGVIETNN